MAMKRKIKCVELNKVFGSVQEASKELNISKSLISMCINKKRDTANGYHFKKVKGKHKKESQTFTPISDTISKQFPAQSVDTQENKGDSIHTDVLTDIHTIFDNITEKSFVESDLKNIIDMMIADFIAYRERTIKLRDEYKKLKEEYEELKSHPHSNQSNDELQAEFDKILDEKRAKFENLVHLYKNVCNERDGLSDRIRTIISSPEYKPFRNRERREANERAKKDKEEWNIIDDTDDDTDDEFSAFGTFPERKQTQKHYEDDI